MTNRPALLLYCQHSLGLGHLKRSWALAEALSTDFRVVMASGGAAPQDLKPPAGIETIDLPAVAQDEQGRLIVVDDEAPVGDVLRIRRRMLLDAYEGLRPSAVVIELFPFGRRKFRDELIPLLEEARRAPRPIVASSVRDLLVDRGLEQQQHDNRAAAILNAYFDVVLVHSDPRFSTLAETFRPSESLRIPVVHTGFVVPGAARDVPPRGRRILVSGGGGRFAERLYLMAIAAHTSLGPGAPPMLIVAGPLCPSGIRERLLAAAAGNPGVHVVATVPDLLSEMRASAVSVSQCGYNTALDILRAGIPALVVPFADNGDSEQTERASRLARVNALRVLAPECLDAERLAAAIQETLAFVPGVIHLDMDGARSAARTLTMLVRSATFALTRSGRTRHESLA
jgi:predicted glycosyltransferase